MKLFVTDILPLHQLRTTLHRGSWKQLQNDAATNCPRLCIGDYFVQWFIPTFYRSTTILCEMYRSEHSCLWPRDTRVLKTALNITPSVWLYSQSVGCTSNLCSRRKSNPSVKCLPALFRSEQLRYSPSVRLICVKYPFRVPDLPPSPGQQYVYSNYVLTVNMFQRLRFERNGETTVLQQQLTQDFFPRDESPNARMLLYSAVQIHIHFLFWQLDSAGIVQIFKNIFCIIGT